LALTPSIVVKILPQRRKPTLIQFQTVIKIDSPNAQLVLQTFIYDALHKLHLATCACEFLLASCSDIIRCRSSFGIPGITAKGIWQVGIEERRITQAKVVLQLLSVLLEIALEYAHLIWLGIDFYKALKLVFLYIIPGVFDVLEFRFQGQHVPAIFFGAQQGVNTGRPATCKEISVNIFS